MAWTTAKFYDKVRDEVVTIPWIEVNKRGQLRSYRTIRGSGILEEPRMMEPKMYGERRYLAIAFRLNGRQYQPLVHRIVLTTFRGRPEDPTLEGAHNDGDTLNNRLKNLRWSTASDNCKDKTKHGTMAAGSKHGRSKLTEQDVIDMLFMYRSGDTIPQIISQFDEVSDPTVRQILKGERWKYLHVKIARGEIKLE